MSEASFPHIYAIALGSNRRHGKHGAPQHVIAAALAALRATGCAVLDASSVIASPAMGPSRRRYANAAAVIGATLSPLELLAAIKAIERDFGRRPGQRWGARVLDLDIILWSGGHWRSKTLCIPHREWKHRRFVADPLASIVRDWRDPETGLTARQIAHRLRRPRPVDPARATP